MTPNQNSLYVFCTLLSTELNGHTLVAAELLDLLGVTSAAVRGFTASEPSQQHIHHIQYSARHFILKDMNSIKIVTVFERISHIRCQVHKCVRSQHRSVNVKHAYFHTQSIIFHIHQTLNTH